MRKGNGSGAVVRTAVHDGYPVWAVFAVDSEAALLPVYERVEPLQERYSQDEIWVHWRYSQSQVESNRGEVT